MKYKKKPVVIEAYQYNGGEVVDAPQWIKQAFDDDIMFFECRNLSEQTPRYDLLIRTLEGIHLANKGDYIIKGIKGELYPCKPYIFEETYELVEQ